MLNMANYIENGTIDCVITDPPYGLTSITKRFGKEGSAPAKEGKDGSFAQLSKGFMGKEWDGSGIEYNVDAWKKCFNALKDGGYLLAFGGTRTFHRIACAIEDAGFEIRDTIMYIYGSGFPKSMDISKQIDKKGGNDYSKQFAKDLKQARESRNLTMKYCDDKYCNGSTNWSWYEGRPKGMRVPDYNTYLEIVKDFPELEKYRELIKEAEREVIGTTITNKTVYQNIGGKNISGEIDITIPETDLAKQWQGWGTALKPAYEPIIVARKPMKTSVAENVIKNRVGGINIDECRVGTENISVHNAPKGTFAGGEYDRGSDTESYREHTGRFPANIIHDGSNEVVSLFPDSKGAGGSIPNSKITGYGKNIGDGTYEYYGGDRKVFESGSGSASRFFYSAKASKKDRDEGLDAFELGRNTHPTVKPTELMQYLIRLVAPKGATILDCFMGSNSTGKAAMFENRERNANYKFIGIELTDEYLPICEARIEYAINKYEYDEKVERARTGQISLFDELEE